jgi:tripartite ATP-independent transporter DctM subunit
MIPLALLMFFCLFALLLSGFPVAFCLGGCALIFSLIGGLTGEFYMNDLSFVPIRIWGIVQNYTLIAVPLFIFMGIILSKTGIAEDLLETMAKSIRRQKGALAYSVIIIGALLAASTGIAGATVVTMGVLTLPTMLSNNYDKQLSCGTIAASGTLGQIIPPSIVLVLLGDMMNVDIGDLFMGALIPGFLLVILYLIYVKVRVTLQPELAPVDTNDLSSVTLKELGIKLIPAAILIITVLGSILFGIASPTEAAACGAIGSIILASTKRKLNRKTLLASAEETVSITSMIFMLLIGAQFFGIVFRGLSGDTMIADVITNLALSPATVLFSIMVLFFLLGFFLDFLEICFIVIPIMMPIMSQLGYDPLWLAVLIAMNLQTSFLTPPFGFALFYLKSVVPKEVTTIDIYKGVIPFVLIQLFALIIISLFPDLVLWLPNLVFK